MKKRFCLLSVAVSLMSLAACDKTSLVYVTSVELNKNVLTLTEGASETLSATVIPGDATDLTVIWDSSDKNVATVNGSGRVTARALGQATITATANDGSGKFGACAVTVEAVPVTGIKLNKEVLPLVVGTGGTLIATVTPGNATDKAVSWDSSDKTVATVDENGKVTAIAPGETTITATANDSSGKSGNCVVSVVENIMGTASFKTTVIWTIAGKTWSDAVMATRCRKTDFNGGVYGKGEYKADCRSNEYPGDDYNPAQVYGDWFSWKAVETYGSVLCPEPWRTPTAQDFKDLDIALGGNGTNNEMLAGRINRYLQEWGGEFGGYCWMSESGLVVDWQTSYACYWTGESVDMNNGASLHFGTPRGYISPAGQADKVNGYTLRCVK